MDPIRIRVSRIIDFGTIVSIVGDDITSKRPVTIHVDHRPFQSFWETWKSAGQPQPIEFDADRLTLNLDLEPDEEVSPDETHDGPAAA